MEGTRRHGWCELNVISFQMTPAHCLKGERNKRLLRLPSIWRIYVPVFFPTNWLLPSESRCQQNGELSDNLGPHCAGLTPICLSLLSKQTHPWDKMATCLRSHGHPTPAFAFSNISTDNSHIKFYLESQHWILLPFLVTCSFLQFVFINTVRFYQCLWHKSLHSIHHPSNFFTHTLIQTP